MVGRIYHVGLTVSDLDRSIAFYRDILGLEFQGEIFMEGEETDKMFRKENCKARVAYLNGSKVLEAPPVELIQFVDSEIIKNDQTCLRHLSQNYAFTRMTLILSTKPLSKIMWSASLNRSISISEQMDLGKAERFISETRMESFLR